MPSATPRSKRQYSDEQIAAAAVEIVTPIDYFGPAYAAVGHDSSGSRIYFGLEGGIKRSAFVGPGFENPSDACALAKKLNERATGYRIGPGPNFICHRIADDADAAAA